MYRIFGKKKEAAPAAPPPDLNVHIGNLSAKVPELDQKIAQIDAELVNIKKQLAAARTPGQQQQLKQKALGLLKRKKLYEQQRGSMQQRVFNLEQTTFAIDSVKQAQEHAAALKYAATELKSAQGAINLDELEDLHEDMNDLLADADEINEVMSREYAVGEQVNEDDLNAELATLDDQLDSIPDSAGPVDTGAAAGPVAAGGGGASAVPAGMDAELDSLGGGGGGGSKQPAWMMPMPPSGGGGGGTAARVPTAASYGR